jgi:hypothetical protein
VILIHGRCILEERINEALKGRSSHGRPPLRAPRYVIEDVINNQEFPDIGGDIQLGIADVFGFRPYALCKPRVQGKPEAYLSYLGYDLSTDLTKIGEAKVRGLNGNMT